MTALELAVLFFLRAELAASAGALLVLALRAPARRLFGAELAYRLWVLPLVVAAASLLPTVQQFVGRAPRNGSIWPGDWAGLHLAERHAALLLGVWSLGVAVLALFIAIGEWRFRVQVRRRRAGPAVVGAGWPRLIVPHDYHDRFTAAERAFIREHERVHMMHGHLKDNLLIAVLQAVSWFNPLVHLACACARLDQELACDAVVIERHPRERRAYAEALLKAETRDFGSPLACFLARHPLELRFKLLAQKPVSLRRYMTGLKAISAVSVLAALLVLWGFSPA
jgi:beta-lactamase regulating signal transducer with metallopeptidase domain